MDIKDEKPLWIASDVLHDFDVNLIEMIRKDEPGRSVRKRV